MKRITAMALALFMLLALCACGGGGKDASVDLDALGEQMLASGGFTDAMSPPPDGVGERLYGIEEGAVKKLILYTGTGATAEELFLAEAADGSAAKTLADACRTRVENQKLVFRNYAPDEVAKLDDAVLLTQGNYVVLAVSGDGAAARAAAEAVLGS